jgi:hypothetical protein
VRSHLDCIYRGEISRSTQTGRLDPLGPVLILFTDADSILDCLLVVFQRSHAKEEFINSPVALLVHRVYGSWSWNTSASHFLALEYSQPINLRKC